MWKILIVGLMLSAAACDVSSSSTNSNGVDPGFGSQDAAGDVTLVGCGPVKYGIITCNLEIKNSSGGTSDYYVEAVLLDKSGANVGDGNASASHVAAGQTAKTDLTGIVNGNEKDVTVKITTVQRTAS